MDKLQLLKSVFVFGGLEESLLKTISQHLKEEKFRAGSEIFAQGRPADSFFIIDSGEVTIVKKLFSGHEKVLAVLGPGSVFGEMAFFSDSPRTADAVSKTDTALWKIERNDFMKIISDEPGAGTRILSSLLHVSMERLENTSNELATVYHTGKIISACIKLSETLKQILDEILLAIPLAQKGAVFIYNQYNDEYDPAAAPSGTKEAALKSPLVNYLKDKTEGAFITGNNEIKLLNEELFANTVSLLVSPVIKEFKMHGFILLWNDKIPNAFTNNNLLLTGAVASQLAEAIENIHYNEEEINRRRLNNARQGY